MIEAMFNLNVLRKKETKKRRSSSGETIVMGQVKKVLSSEDQKLIVMVRS